jgi:hypothetical protein
VFRNAKPDVLRIWLTFGIAVFGILVVLIAFLVAVEKFGPSNNPGQVIAAVIGPLTGVVGTLAGYVAGQAAGAAGKEKAEERAAGAEARTQAILDVAPEGTMDKAKHLHSELFWPGATPAGRSQELSACDDSSSSRECHRVGEAAAGGPAAGRSMAGPAGDRGRSASGFYWYGWCLREGSLPHRR